MTQAMEGGRGATWKSWRGMYDENMLSYVIRKWTNGRKKYKITYFFSAPNPLTKVMSTGRFSRSKISTFVVMSP